MKNIHCVRKVTWLLSILLVYGVSASAHATLVDNGDGTVTETDTNLMWLKNANTPGLINWGDATDWADTLVFAGYRNWRLPTTDETCDGGSNCTESEMGHLYYVSLGNPAHGPLGNSGPFSDIQTSPPYDYWSSTVPPTLPGVGCVFNWSVGGQQCTAGKSNHFYAWSVRDISVPEPSTLFLFASALLPLAWWRRRDCASSCADPRPVQAGCSFVR